MLIAVHATLLSEWGLTERRLREDIPSLNMIGTSIASERPKVRGVFYLQMLFNRNTLCPKKLLERVTVVETVYLPWKGSA